MPLATKQPDFSPLLPLLCGHRIAVSRAAPSSRRSSRSDIVHRVTPLATSRPKFALAVWVVVTLLYGSLCSTTCSLGACPIGAQNAATHDCDHDSSATQRRHSPQNPDCPKHHHPTFDAVSTDSLAQSQLTGAIRIATNQWIVVAAPNQTSSASSHAPFSDLAPPPDLNFALYQKFSVLRI